MRVAVLGAATGWHVRRLADALHAAGHAATVVGWHDLATDIGPAEHHRPEAVDRAQVIVVRGMPAGTLEDVIFRMDLLGRLACRRRVVNAPRALEVAIDKYLTLTRLHDAGILGLQAALAGGESQRGKTWNLGSRQPVGPNRPGPSAISRSSSLIPAGMHGCS